MTTLQLTHTAAGKKNMAGKHSRRSIIYEIAAAKMMQLLTRLSVPGSCTCSRRPDRPGARRARRVLTSNQNKQKEKGERRRPPNPERRTRSALDLFALTEPTKTRALFLDSFGEAESKENNAFTCSHSWHY